MGAGLASAAAVMYLLAASAVAPKLGPAGRPTLALVALAMHAAALLQTLVHEGQLTVGVSEALSLFAWQAAVLLWILCLTQQLQVLTLAVYPLAAIAALTAGLVPSSVTGIPLVEWKLQLHVALSLFAAGFLSLAAVQALAVAVQDRRLHRRRETSTGLAWPPLQTMESLLFQLIAAGFFMLSLSLATGLLFVDDLLAQHLAHKTVLTSLAWLIFGTLLWGRWRSGWRGRAALRWTICGYLVLFIGYFGSKFVLEQMLGKHWT